MSQAIISAAQYAREKHEGQVRKYNGRPYITHPIRVAGRVATHPSATEDIVVAAFLHDVVEDCEGVRLQDIHERFGEKVTTIVDHLTNAPKKDGVNRAHRKRADRERISKIPDECKLIKLIDRLDNLLEMQGCPDNFRLVYADESELLLDVLSGIDDDLESECEQLILDLRAV